jgi:hypothetical protein
VPQQSLLLSVDVKYELNLDSMFVLRLLNLTALKVDETNDSVSVRTGEDRIQMRNIV